MINKIFTGLAILMIGVLFLYILSESIFDEKSFNQTMPTFENESQSVELMAIMENDMAKGELNHQKYHLYQSLPDTAEKDLDNEKDGKKSEDQKDSNKDKDQKDSNKDKDQKDSSMVITEDLPDYTKLYPNLYTVNDLPQKMDQGKKIAYLTFDDGPSENTYKILDILQEENISATFFIIGSAIDDEVERSLKRMVNEGHTIGIHTYSHLCNEIYCSIERYLDDFNMVYEQIYDITGERVNLYRFPWGSNNGYTKGIKDALIDEMSRRGFSCYDWNVSADDSVGKPSAYSILHNITKDLTRHDYPIILMHDSKINDLTVQLLPQIIELIRSKGYEFGSLEDREPYQFQW